MGKTPAPHILAVKDYADFMGQVNLLGYRGWVYRGHARTDWHIESSLQRFYRTHRANIDSDSDDVREDDAIRKFRRAAHHFLHGLPPDRDVLTWLAIMQHYGAPTRLVDFTFSPLVALFFAVEGSVVPVPFAKRSDEREIKAAYRGFHVHAVHLDSVRHHVRNVLSTGDKRRASKNPSLEDYCIGKSEKQTRDFVGFFEGGWQTPRQTAQQSLFMIPSRVHMDIEEFLGSVDGDPAPHRCPWLRFDFTSERSAYREIVKNLMFGNVTATSLFPGLEGLAKGLYFRMYEVVKHLD